ncbi:RIP metalloprotease RseP [Chlorobium phaeovibrioides]|uniref:Zinc metalloprotease n=1 Tax=Chlorobium phaeovibrioides TaxID=1094 RepID=A0A3S0LPJ4_CHLPH|nr:RIP metalloprotease RseP [Chlorobium phaeovibrioides]RTY34629.1 RIP metalloprotease RseP [Chlorobium phaeovibrioides]RTY37731.1 RIP metalloprotease RseP [Chlorobium phaeovibrioides]
MDFLSTIFFFIVAIFILVTVHELGHFLTAKLFGMRVDKFYIGFDFYNMRLWKKKIGDTEYGLGVFPLGGYVKIAGMVDESLDTDFEASAPQPWEFRAKPVWQRLIVLAGGVTMNLLLAAAIFIGVTYTLGESRTSTATPAFVETGSIFDQMGLKTGDRFVEANGTPVATWEDALDPERFTAGALTYTILRNGTTFTISAPKNILTKLNEAEGFGIRPIVPPVIDQVMAGNPAEQGGLKPGDLITAIGGDAVSDWTEVVGIISSHPGKALNFTWKDSAATLSAAITPGKDGKIGIMLRQPATTERVKLSFPAAVASGFTQTWKMSALTVQGFGKIFSGQEDFRKSVGGPIKIAKIANRSAEQGPVSFLFFLAVLSISLAIINMLPIPALDGGQFAINAVEGIIRREIPFAVKMRIQQIGMVLLLTLFAYILINDILNP